MSETASQKIAKSRNIFGYFAETALQKAINALLLLQNKSQVLSANLLTAAPFHWQPSLYTWLPRQMEPMRH